MMKDEFIQGDTLEVLKGMDTESIDFILTSPPYPGNPFWGEAFKPENWQIAHEGLGLVWDECVRVLKPGCKLAINIANTCRRPLIVNTAIIHIYLMDKIEPIGEIIWTKGVAQTGTAWGSWLSPADPSLSDSHEYILIYRKYGDRHKPETFEPIPQKLFCSWRNSVWSIAPVKRSQNEHPAPFPVAIPLRLITLYTFKDETVLDPFMGSGQTALACIETNRHYIGIEHNPEYVQQANERIKQSKAQLSLW